MMSDENDEKINVNFKSYKSYFGQYWNGCVFFVLANFAMVGFMVCWLSGDYLVGNWAMQPDQKSRFGFYCGLSFVFAGCTSLFTFFRILLIVYHGWK